MSKTPEIGHQNDADFAVRLRKQGIDLPEGFVLGDGEMKAFLAQMHKFLSTYQFGIDEMLTKINILRADLKRTHNHSPIEHVSSRMKSPESIARKVARGNYALSLDNIREHVLDIAGIRITCSFLSDVYKVSDLLIKQQDVSVVKIKDYVSAPKPNGYRSLHLLVTVPVFLSDSVQNVPVEIQIRTIAMDFWASLEHSIYYKYDRDVPGELLDELTEAASIANSLDVRMERLLNEIHAGDEQ